MRRSLLVRALGATAPVWLTLASGAVILWLAGANPITAYGHLFLGAFESGRKLADVVMAMVPLLLCASGMLITFAAGLWNIGVEGQMIAGALMTTWLVQVVTSGSPPEGAGRVTSTFALLGASVLAGMLGGALWGLLTGALRVFGRVNEIFAGLGLNYLALALTNYLIFGPWKPPGGATMSGTAPFPQAAWMPLIGDTRASPVSIALAFASIVLVYFALRDTIWGLKLKAIGLNVAAAHRLGIDTTRNMLLAFVACGALAGIAGSLQATAVYRRLIPSISGGYGYLAQLVVLLSGLRAGWVLPIVFFYGVIQVGGPRLELRTQLDSSLGGVLQAGVVLFFLLVRGLRDRAARGARPVEGGGL
ncbi:MAG: ABC transporter permease [Chloroflexi bacterium]|nr:ABC transporter permease [Chloroflexota bacterium]